MKRMMIGSGLSLGLVRLLVAQPATFYVNDGIVVCPPQTIPQIDAINFVNNNFFSVNPSVPSPRPYYTAHTLNFTNRGVMDGNLGFDLSNFVPEAPPTEQFRMASSMYNIGSITIGTSTNISSLGIGLGKLLVSASNIYSPGSIMAGQDCFMNIQGKDVDLNHGLVVMEGFSDEDPANNLRGLFSGYWGIDTNVMPTFAMPVPRTPFHQVTDRYNLVFQQRLTLNNALAYATNLVSFDGSNIFTRAVFIRNTNTAMSAQVYFPGNFGRPPIIVEWKWTRNLLFSTTTTDDYLYLQDTLGNGAIPGLVFTGLSGPRPTYRPSNFSFTRGGPQSFGLPASPIQSLSLPSAGRTNDASAYRALFQPTTVVIGDTAGQNATNLPGRIQISASDRLDLEYTRIGGPNTMELTATNHFVGSKAAQIAVPLAQITLRNTNGLLAITNLMSPAIPRPEGTLDLYSCRWTNEVAGITNIFHVLFVDSQFSPVSPGRIQDLNLSATNLLVSDVLNIVRYFIFDGTHLTLTTNAPSAPVAAGAINLLSSAIVWSNAFPRLSFLTNYGTIQTMNAVYFGGARSAPFFSTNFNEPYEVFVNRGGVTNEGTLIWSKIFDNSGKFYAGSGSFTLQANQAVLRDGWLGMPGGDVNITAASLGVTNHPIRAGRSLNLTITNLLHDGGVVTNGNTWVIGTAGSSVPGFSLRRKPTLGDLLVTTVSNFVPAFGNFIVEWAANDRGRSIAGFSNNAALGRLILDGNENSTFTFRGMAVSNALYVDYLEFRDYTTTTILNGQGNVDNVQIDPNMVVYYAQAMAADGTVAERINNANGGRFRWVPAYAGHYSSTDVVYPDGTTNALNAALVGSQNLDSDSDGIPNSQDLSPVLRPQDLDFQVRVSGPAAAELSWRTIVDGTNYVYYTNALPAAGWQLLTNFVSSGLMPAPGGVRVSVTEPVPSVGRRYYRVRVDAPQP